MALPSLKDAGLCSWTKQVKEQLAADSHIVQNPQSWNGLGHPHQKKQFKLDWMKSICPEWPTAKLLVFLHHVTI